MITKDFILAGESIFTLAIPEGFRLPDSKGQPTALPPHYTFRVKHVEKGDRWPEAWFVGLLTGSDNTKDYTYLGRLDAFTSEVHMTTKSGFPAEHPAVRLLRRVLARVWSEDHVAYEKHGFKLEHCGYCGKCRKLLTHPTSVATGFGPECRKKIGK